MEENELKKTLETLSVPDFTELSHGKYLKLAIINAKKSSRITFWLLSIPLLILFSAFLQSMFKVSIPPWSWLQKFSPFWPVWIRFGVFLLVLIVIPSIVVIVNLLSILWLYYDRKEHILHVSIRVRKFNIIIIVAAGLLALLFIGHSLIDFFNGTH
ncbi:MAG TPA: hypothetical protein VGZ90_16475 [Puia sp.]|jgi:hypothetical protein|nr:hypothetical protein [Puia sp.]